MILLSFQTKPQIIISENGYCVVTNSAIKTYLFSQTNNFCVSKTLIIT